MRRIINSFIAISITLISLAHASVPTLPATDQQKLLESSDAKLAANKKIAYDFFRVVLRGKHLDQVSKYMRDDYIQHNPNVETGMQGFVNYFSKLGGPRATPKNLEGLVAIQAEGDYVTLSFVYELQDPKNKNAKYTSTWFDMFRIQDGKIAEHWDCDTK